MANTYKLKTSTDAKIDYNLIEVEVSTTTEPIKYIKTIEDVEREISTIDEEIKMLGTKKTSIQAELVLMKKEADKVLTATNK